MKLQMKVTNNLSESEIQRQICEWLEYHNCFFTRINNQGNYSKKGDFYYKNKYQKNGIADILVIKKGIITFIEVKSKTGKQSEEQIQFQKEVESQGAKYLLVKSLDEVIEALTHG